MIDFPGEVKRRSQNLGPRGPRRGLRDEPPVEGDPLGSRASYAEIPMKESHRRFCKKEELCLQRRQFQESTTIF